MGAVIQRRQVSVSNPRIVGYLKRHIKTPLNHPSERTVRTDSCRFNNRSREFRTWETLTLSTQENNLGKTPTNIHALVGFQHTIAMCVPYKTDCEATVVSNSLHLLLDTHKTAFQLRSSLSTVHGPRDDTPGWGGVCVCVCVSGGGSGVGLSCATDCLITALLRARITQSV